ncbi:MAG: hypothetical protein WAN04_05505 [Candidatus Udaeobacter sp.]
MKMLIVKRARVSSIAIAILLCAINNIPAQARKGPALNEDAFPFAMQLIREGHFIADSKGAWRGHQPSANEENEFIRLHGFGEYAKWHLGIDDHYPENTKQRYKFPYGDFKNVHRCGLLAAKARARQYGHTEIENAAAKLEQAVSMQSKSSARLGLPIRASSRGLVQAHVGVSIGLPRSASDTNAATTQSVHDVKNASINSGKSSL